MRRLLRWLSRISIRLLAFNLLLVFLPAAGMLLLGTYERHLLDAQERTMVQEGRLLAAALEVVGRLETDDARRILVQLGQRHEARLRVIDMDGELLADSAAIGARLDAQREAGTEASPQPSEPAARNNPLYRVGSLPFRLLRRLTQPPADDRLDTFDQLQVFDGPEIRAALSGRYGATTRISSGSPPTVTLYCAIPIRFGTKVQGAVLVSQSTTRIMRALYAVRLDIFEVFLASLGVAVVLTLIVSLTIARPLAGLRRQAEAILDRKGRLRGGFTPSRRWDEIGELSRALAALTRRLEGHIQGMESFTSDVAHEFKNPLASIRTATEMALEVDEPAERERFLSMIQRDVARMERLLTGAREVSRIDARLDEEEREAVNLETLLQAIVEGFRLRLEEHGPTFVLAVASHELVVSASADRLTQVFENVLDNAVSFSPEHSKIAITLRTDQGNAVVVFSDEGPGIPEEHTERVFQRFFSYRRQMADDDHSGIGLAIVKAIIDGYGGSVWAAVGPGGKGTAITIRLPLHNAKEEAGG